MDIRVELGMDVELIVVNVVVNVIIIMFLIDNDKLCVCN